MGAGFFPAATCGEQIIIGMKQSRCIEMAVKNGDRFVKRIGIVMDMSGGIRRLLLRNNAASLWQLRRAPCHEKCDQTCLPQTDHSGPPSVCEQT